MSDVACTLVTASNRSHDIKSGSEANIPQLSEPYVKAEIKDGKWSFYSGISFPQDSKVQVLDKIGDYPLEFSPKSAKTLLYEMNAIVLFSHPHFTGKEEIYISAENNITDVFPPNEAGGVSSAIVWPKGEWEVYTDINQGGISDRMQQGQYESPGKLPFGGDKIQSLAPRH